MFCFNFFFSKEEFGEGEGRDIMHDKQTKRKKKLPHENCSSDAIIKRIFIVQVVRDGRTEGKRIYRIHFVARDNQTASQNVTKLLVHDEFS